MKIEQELPDQAPRMFVGSKVDRIEERFPAKEALSKQFVVPSFLLRPSDENSASEMRWRILMQNHEVDEGEDAI